MHHPNRFSPLTLLAGLLLLVGCARDASEPPDSATATPPADTGRIERLSPEAFLAQRRATDVVLDVRTPEEYAAGHLRDAFNIDMLAADFQARVDTLDRDHTYYLYCRSGNRSQQAAEIMKKIGFRSLYNVGGFNALAKAGADTTVP